MSKGKGHCDIDGGWSWFVLVSVYGAIVVNSTTSYMGGVLYVAVLDELGGDKAASALIGSLNIGLLCLFGPVSSLYMNAFSCRVAILTGALLSTSACLLSAFVNSVGMLILTFGILGGPVSSLYMNAFSCRVAILTGALLSTSACLLSAFVNSVGMLILTFGILGGIGNSLICTPLVVVLGYYFETHRKTIISVSCAVIGIGVFLSTPVALAILDKYGLSGSFMILSGINAHVCLTGVICRPSPIEKLIRQKAEDVQSFHTSAGQSSKNSAIFIFFKKVKSRFNIGILRQPTFTIFVISTMTWNVTLSVMLMHLPNYMLTQGATSVEVTVAMTCFSVGNTAGRFFIAFIVDRKWFDTIKLYTIALGLTAVISTTFPIYSHVNTLQYVYAAFSGILIGVPNSLATPIVLDIVGVDMLSTGHGIEFLFCGAGYVVGPPIAGYLFSQTNAYESSFYFAGAVIAIGSLLGAASSVLFQRSQTTRGKERADARENEGNLDIVLEIPVKVNSDSNSQPLLDRLTPSS